MSKVEQLQIGVAKYEFSPTDMYGVWHKIMPGSNLYRILPPLFSYAAKGKWVQFYAVHEVYLSNGKRKKFRCIKNVDFKTKQVLQECPYCVQHEEGKAKVEIAKKAGNLTPTDLEKARTMLVDAYKVDKKYYLNAVDSDNQIGLLSLPGKAFKSLENECKKLSDKGINAADISNGVFFNIEKIQKFKGDRDTEYKASVAVVEHPDGTMTRKMHDLTPELIEQLKTKATDLSELFTVLSFDDINALANASVENRKLLADRLFAKPEEEEEVETPDSLKTTIPGTTAQAVARVETTPNGLDVTVPSIAKNEEQVKKAVEELPVMEAPKATKAQDIKTKTNLSDDEFNAMFGGK